MLISGKTLIVVVDPQELRRVALTNLFGALLNGKNVLLLECKSVESIDSAQIFSDAMKNTAPLFILNSGLLRLADPQIARDIAVLRLLIPQCLVLVMVDADWNGEIDVAVSLAINGVVSMSMPPRDVIAAIEIAMMGGRYFPKVRVLGKGASILPMPISKAVVAQDTNATAQPLEPVADRLAEFNIGRVAEISGMPRVQIEDKVTVDIQLTSTGVDKIILSRRQIEVLKTLQSGLSNKEIARSLGLSEATIKIHVSHLMRKFGVANRTQVAVLSRQGGILGQTANPVAKHASFL